MQEPSIKCILSLVSIINGSDLITSENSSLTIWANFCSRSSIKWQLLSDY